MKKDNFPEKKKIELPKHKFTNQEESRAWYDPYKKATKSSLTKERKVAMSGFSRGIDEIRDTENDIKEKQKELENVKSNTQKKKKNIKVTVFTILPVLIFSLVMVVLGCLNKYGINIVNVNFIQSAGAISSLCLVAGIVPFATVCLYYEKSCLNELTIEKEIQDLQNKLVSQKNKKKAKEYIKNMSARNKKMINELYKNIKLREPKKEFGMTYEELLKLYEEINGFGDEELEKYSELTDESIKDIISEENLDFLEENFKVKRKKYKIIGRKLKEQ